MKNSESKSASEMDAAIGSARAAYSQLRILNSGGIAGREPLESALDRSVVMLSKLIPNTEGAYLENISRALREIRDYRRLFPRNAAFDPEQAEQAQKILGELSRV